MNKKQTEETTLEDEIKDLDKRICALETTRRDLAQRILKLAKKWEGAKKS